MSLSQRPRIRALQSLALRVQAAFGGDLIVPDPDPINTKLSAVFSGEITTPEIPPFAAPVIEPETAEERLVGDMALYWNGIDAPSTGPRGGSSVAPFPSVMLTEMIMHMGPTQKRALAIHLGLEQILEEQAEKIAQAGYGLTGATYGLPAIKRVSVGVVQHDKPYIAIPPLDQKMEAARQRTGKLFPKGGIQPVDVVTALERNEGLVKVLPRND